ncbi:hypothetical protein [Streptomyces sp. NPDC052225]|uniref:hypothetical protein n=1 Tax=Streptomyces sp. NPDC052225 TaxID=3154949 RepID=UPI00342D0113
MTDRTLRLLRDDPRLAALAAFPFAFDLGRTTHVEDVRLACGGGLRPVAGSDTGGTYFVCDDGAVLYADSEGAAGVVGASVDEAVEILVGLPACPAGLTADAPPEEILARVAEAEEEMREECAPELDAQRAQLRKALGFAERSPAELLALLDAALASTEPDHLLLNAAEGRAYRPLAPWPRRPLWEPVLARGRADLAALRADASGALDAVADPVRRTLVLRAAQFDRRATDLPFLRRLLAREARDAGMTEELRLAAVLVGLAGDPDDLALLHAARATTYDTHLGLSGIPDRDATAEHLRAWAREWDDSLFGDDPADEPFLAWVELALAQDLTELARTALVRRLDEDPWEAVELSTMRGMFEELGDTAQALRTQRHAVAVAHPVPGSYGRVSALLTLARLEREGGQLAAAVDTLTTLRDQLDRSDDELVRHWRGVMLGVHLTREHYAVAAAGLPAAQADAVRAAADALRAQLSEPGARSV